MTDADMYRAWTSDGPLLIAREERLWLMAESAVGQGGLTRVTRSLDLDASDEDIRAALRELADDVTVAAARFPTHFRALDRQAHGDSGNG